MFVTVAQRFLLMVPHVGMECEDQLFLKTQQTCSILKQNLAVKIQ